MNEFIKISNSDKPHGALPDSTPSYGPYTLTTSLTTYALISGSHPCGPYLSYSFPTQPFTPPKPKKKPYFVRKFFERMRDGKNGAWANKLSKNNPHDVLGEKIDFPSCSTPSGFSVYEGREKE